MEKQRRFSLSIRLTVFGGFFSNSSSDTEYVLIINLERQQSDKIIYANMMFDKRNCKLPAKIPVTIILL